MDNLRTSFFRFAAACSFLVANSCSDEVISTALDCRTASSDVYPKGTCGKDVGSIIPNYTFTGRREGKNSTNYETFKLAAYHDPSGTKYSYMSLNVSGVWCLACKQEAVKIPQYQAKYASKGVVFFTNLAEDKDTKPSTKEDIDRWIELYELTSIVANDPDFVLSAFFNKLEMPMNLLIDLRTMKIIKKVIGSDFSSIEAELDKLTAGK